MAFEPLERGTASDVAVYRNGRRCKLCHKKLNSYNPNKYCHVHSFKGALLKIKQDDRRAYQSNLKCKNKKKGNKK